MRCSTDECKTVRFGARASGVAILALAAGIACGIALADDHAHVEAVVSVSADALGSPGDVLGVYAIELLPCARAARAGSRLDALFAGLSALLVPSAHANHRERFDGPAAKEVLRRVPLDQAQATALGELIVPRGTYCEVRLTLARLPAVQGPVPIPALPASLRLARPGALPPFLIDYSQPVAIGLTERWNAGNCPARLTVLLRPGKLRPLLANAALDFGELSQRVLAALAEQAEARPACR